MSRPHYRVVREIPGLYSVPGLVDRFGESPYIARDAGPYVKAPTWVLCTGRGTVLERFLTLADARASLVNFVQAADLAVRP